VKDRMLINGLRLSCIIGTKPVERKRKQKIIIDLNIECDLRRAGRTDKLDDAVNYKILCEKVVSLVRNSRFFLIEKMAESIASSCLENSRIRGVGVRIEKPGALNTARSVAVEICRRRGEK